MENTTLQISELMINNPQMTSFTQLLGMVRRAAAAGAVNLSFDLKPDYQDTPRDWQDRLEAAFCSVVPEIR